MGMTACFVKVISPLEGPQGQKRLTDVIGNAVHVIRIATGQIEAGVAESIAA
jgi:hypothetical protein